MTASTRFDKRTTGKLFALLGLLHLLAFHLTPALAVVDGVTGTSFDLTAKAGYISTPDGDSILTWGYALGAGVMQYPGPTLIVNQGDTVTINLTNTLARPVSLMFPGQSGVSATGGVAGLITQESTGPADVVTYTFTATHPGTYMYHSATQPDLQIEMGLVGALIVRPPQANQAYTHTDSAYDHEYLFMLSEMDPVIHQLVSLGWYGAIDNTRYHPVLWFINGRNGPDTMADAFVGWLPHQPYNSLPRMRPGERLLGRFISAGRDLHPFHTHGNHMRVIARDGRLMQSAIGAGADLSFEDYTLQAVPGATYDALFTWTGERLGWDIYGTVQDTGVEHACTDTNGDGFDETTYEYCPDHGKAFPVILPELQNLTFGGFYSGSPFLGAYGNLPPGEGGLNLNGGLVYMWHSHTEREIVNNDIFPGGMMTMLIIEPPGTPIP